MEEPGGHENGFAKLVSLVEGEAKGAENCLHDRVSAACLCARCLTRVDSTKAAEKRRTEWHAGPFAGEVGGGDCFHGTIPI